MSIIPENFIFSHRAINTYITCPHFFYLTYLAGWGRLLKMGGNKDGLAFHRYAERHFLGLGDLDCDFPDGWSRDLDLVVATGGLTYPEFQLGLTRHPFSLSARYDLLNLLPSGRVEVYDWKTEKRPLQHQGLRKSLQTIVYRFLAVAAAQGYAGYSVTPGCVSLIYWNPRFPGARVELDYSEQEYLADKTFLTGIIDEITGATVFEARPERQCAYRACHTVCPSRSGERTLAEELWEPRGGDR